jgi:5'-nucleotidase
MHILITNDGGHAATGIKALTEELANVAEISVVAPERNKNGASNSLALTRHCGIAPLQHRLDAP